MEDASLFKILMTAIHPKSSKKKRLEAIIELIKLLALSLLSLGVVSFYIASNSNDLSGMQLGTGLIVMSAVLFGLMLLIIDIKNTMDIELPKEKKKVKIAEGRKRR